MDDTGSGVGVRLPAPVPPHHVHHNQHHSHHSQQHRHQHLHSQSSNHSARSSKAGTVNSYLQNIPGINMNLPANDPSVRTIKQHYYPEGGWGWVIVAVASFTHFITAPFALGSSLMIIEITERFHQHPVSAVFLSSFSTMVTLLASPVVIAICHRKSVRLTGILGGLVTALGCLFTSFATQFHQLFFSYGIFIGVGVAMIRDPAVIIMGQYFKKKRQLVEIPFHASQGLGIAFMPLLITFCTRSRGWRFGFYIMAVIASLAFFLGLLYRSASLYHPQRRAILHLKSLQRRSRLQDQHLKTTAQNSLNSAFSSVTQPSANHKINNNKSKISGNNIQPKSMKPKPSYFDFSVLKSRTVQIILCSTCILHFGIMTPILLMSTSGESDHVDYACLMRLQIFTGLGFMLGSLTFGFIIVSNSQDCLISRQYLCQASSFLLSILVILFVSFDDYKGYVLFSWTYGFMFGGWTFAIKMFILEKVRARNFNRAWSFLQASMSVPVVTGAPLTLFINDQTESKSGFYLSSACIFLGTIAFFLINAHKSSKHHDKISSKSCKTQGGQNPSLTPRSASLITPCCPEVGPTTEEEEGADNDVVMDGDGEEEEPELLGRISSCSEPIEEEKDRSLGKEYSHSRSISA